MKRRALALIIALLMMAQPVAGFAEDPVELDGVVAVDEGLVEDGTLDLDGIVLDDAEDLLGNGADALSLDLALVSNDVESAPLPFEQTAIVGDVRFTMTAAPDTFPANAALSVSAVEDEATLQAVAQSVATDGQHHVYAICVADETGAPLTPGAELPLVRVEGISGDIRVFAYDQEAQRADEIETENGAFKFEKSGLYDIVGEAPAEGGEPAQPTEEAPAEGGEPAQPGDETPAEGGEPTQPGEEAPAEGGEPAQPGEEVSVEGEAPAQTMEEVPAGGFSIEVDETDDIELLPEDIQDDLNGIELDPESFDANPTEALLPFEQSQKVNDVVVTVKADPGVFPANAQLSVKRVPTYKKREAAAAIDEVRDEDQNVAVSYTFDIKVIDPDTREELQPAEGRTVSVSFALSEVSDENLETNVYHIAEAAGELVAESLEVTTENQETAVVETDGFSLYTVEFTYGDLQYVLPGDTSVTMDEILDALNLTGEVTAAEVSNSRLFSASDATGAWAVSALRPFTSTEWMKVTINDVVYKITVTDEIKPEVQYIDENGVTQETSATILAKEEGYKKYTWGATGTDSWYVVDEYIIIPDDPITVSGNVHLILKSSCQLTAYMGIQVPQGSSLTIYADSENPDNMGILEVTAGWSSTDAGIGGGGNITINGGKVTATGNGGGAGIGGDSVSPNGAIVINGGIVMATGVRGGAGIGGGNGGAGGSITINGGEVIAIGGSDGAGIGFGKDYNSAVGTTVSINGGKVVTSGKEGISKGKNGNADILSVGTGLYVYDSANSDEKKWTPIDIIDGSYDRCAHMAVYNKVPALVAEHTVGQNTYPYYNANTPIAQFVQKGGTLKLHQNLTYSGTVFLGEHDGVNSFTLDLNGYGLINNSGILSEEVIDVLQGATFELIDSEPTRNHKYTLKDGMAVDIDKSGSKSFKGGYITGGASGGVYIAGNGQFTMNAGTIIGNGSAGVGPGVELDDKDAVFIMRGGSIIGNKARQGSGVYVDKGTFKLSGKPIIAENYGSNVYLNGSNRIDITGPLESGTSVYLTMQNVGVFTNGFDEHHTVGVDNPSTWPSAYFHSDATGVKVLLSVNETLTTDDNEAKLGKHKHDYTCKAATDDAGEQIIRITCANNDCGHEGATEYTLGLTVPDSWVYGNTVELASFLDAEALEAFNEAFDGDPSMQVTADNNLFFYEKADPDNALAAMPAAAGDYVVELRVRAMEGSGYISISEPFSISPKDLTINGLTAANKEYNGSAAANITGTATLEGVVGTDDVTLVPPSGNQTKAVFVDENGDEDANVGKNKAVKYSAAEPYTIEGNDVSNYNLVQPTGLKAEITAKPVSLVWDTTTPLIYNKKAQWPKVDVKASDLISGDSCEVSTVTGKEINAGDNYTATATALNNANYALPEDEGQLKCPFSIAPKPVDLVWGDTSLTYNGKEQHPAVTVKADDLIAGDECDVTVTGKQTNVGNDYTATASALTNPNYKLPEEDPNAPAGEPKKLSRAFSISPKTASLKWEGTSVVYDGQEHVPAASVTNKESGDDCEVTVTGAQTEVGKYTATATQLSNGNYKLPDDNTVQFQIAAIVAELKWTDTSFDYDGGTHGPKARVTNCVQGETCEVTVEGATSSAGNHTATATALSNVRYMLPEVKTQTFTIAPKTVGLTWTNTDLTYNKQSQAPTATATGLITGDECTVTVDGAKKDVGSYTATATKLSNTNYALPADQNILTQAFTISPKTVDLEWTYISRTYNGKEQSPTVTAKGVISGDKCTVTVEGAKKDVGTYTATATGLSNGNYALPNEATALTKTCEITPITVGLKWGNSVFVYDGGNHLPTATATGVISGDTCEVTVEGEAKDAGKHTATASGLSNGNYVLPAANIQDFNISKKTVGLEWGTSVFTYDGQSHAPTATATDLVQGDKCDVTVTGEKTAAGSYTATASALSNSNYALPKVNTQAFTINKKTVGLTWTNTDLTYNRQSQAPTATATGLVKEDTCTVTVTGGQTNAGNHTATATKLSNGNYALPDDPTQSFTIAPKEVALAWGSPDLTYNGKDQYPEITMTGVISGDTCKVEVEGAEKNVGDSYQAKVTGLTNANYILPKEPTNGGTQTGTTFTRTIAFSISPKTASLKWEGTSVVYDGQKHAPTASVANVEAGDTCTVTVPDTYKQTKVGTYTATASELSNTNYALPDNSSVQFQIAAIVADLEWSNTSFNYDGGTHGPSARVTNCVPGETCEVTVGGATSNAGNHTATATALSNENYMLPKVKTQAFTIAPITVGLIWTNTDLTYNKQSQAPTATPTGLITGDVCTVTVTGATNAGSYTATATKLSNTNYALPADQAVLTRAFTISPKTVDLEWTNIKRTYNGKEQSPTVTAKGVFSGDSCTVTVEGAKKDVGTYTATVTGLNNGNYALPKEATALTKTCEITPKTVSLTWGDSKFTYDGAAHAPAATAGGVISGDTCTVNVTGAQTKVGTYTATADGLSDDNYALPTTNTSKVYNIVQKTVGLEWGTSTFTYDGAAHAPTATATGVVQGDTCDVTVTGEKTTAGSNYTATASALSNTNYALPATKTQKFTINKKPVGLAWSTTSLTYNGKNQTPTATATGLIGNDVCTVTVTDGQRNAGNHTATATKLSNGNYALPDDPTQSYTIAPKELALAWGSPDLTYNGKDQYPEITMTGVISGDTCEVVVEGAQKNVGNGYQAKVTGLTNTNYILPKEPTNGGTQTGTTFTRTMAFSIAQKTAELKWEGTSVVYDGQKHAPTASVANVEAGDTCTVTVPDTYAQTEVGTYTATATQLSNGNYKLPDNSSVQFQIAAIVAQLEWTGTSFNYDGETHGPKARVTNCVPGETCEVTVQGATSSAGKHTAIATALSNERYMLPEVKTQTFTIAPITVGLTWTNTDLTYNRQSQAPTATATGLIGDDVCAVTVTGATNVGSYTATATGLNNSNYALPADQNVLTQAFTISPKTLDLEWKNTSLTYNGNEQRPTVTAKGVISGDKCTLTVEGAKKDVGTYTAIVTGLNNGNYALPKEATALTKTCEITPKTVGLKWESGAFVYDGKAHNLTATATGLISGDTCTVTVTGAAKDAGKHTATASALSNANYALPKANTKEFSISKKTVGLEWGTTAFTYDGTAQVPAATATGLIQGDACAVTVTGEKTAVGSYTATASALSNPNYALPTAKTQKFTIGKKTVGLTWSNTSLTYNGKTQTPTATATGLVAGDTCTVTVTGGQKNAGSHTATATKLSNGNYALPEEATQPFTISPLTVGLSWSNTSLTYNGKEQLPAVKATGLVSGDSCTVTVSGAAVNAGTHTATATALSNGNYGMPEKNTQTFTIAQKAVTVTASDQTIQQGKSIQDNEATLSGAVSGHVLKSVKLAADTANNSITPSDAIIVDANGNDVTANYKISYKTGKLTVTEAAPEPAEDPIDEPVTVKIDVKDCKITVKNQTYTGTERTPAVTVKFEKTKLKQGRDYSVAYTNNVAIGVATVTVKGKGAYTGSRKVNFKILPKKTAFSKITGGKRKITLKWKNPKNITGYQIQYSLKKSFSSYKTVKIKKASILTTTISKLEAKKVYYVRIRTYKVVKGKAYCSAWSTPKAVETL